MGCNETKETRKRTDKKDKENDENKLLPDEKQEVDKNQEIDKKETKLDNNKIKIIVPSEDPNNKWEKEYEKDEIIDNVINDYITENKISLTKESVLQWKCNQQPIISKNKLSTLLSPSDINLNEIVFDNKILKSPLDINVSENDFSPEIIGKLFSNPFQVFAYVIDTNSFIIQSYSPEEIGNSQLDIYYNSTCSYCNSVNKLFISGGIDKTGEIIEKLWIIDLKEEKINGPNNIPPKYNHTMIYIPENYIFFVGGNDLKTFYYNINESKIEEKGNLNLKRFEPALIKVKNYLYCFDNVAKEENNGSFNFEVTDLCSSENNWELITPRISENILKGNISQKFFGVSTDLEGNIIFLGGDAPEPGEEEEGREMKNYRYNINDNIMEISEVPFVNFNLKEKLFMRFKNKSNVSFILPNFSNQKPEVIFFVKDRNSTKVIDYFASLSTDRNRSQQMFNNLRQDDEYPDKKCDFDMPQFS